MILRILYSVLLILLLMSCATKHKVTSREKLELTQKKSKELISSLETKVVSQNTKLEASEIKRLKSTSHVKLTQADPNKRITVIDPDGNETTYVGANVEITESEESERIDQSSSEKQNKEESVKSGSSINEALETEFDSNARTSDSESTGISFWFVMGFFLFLLLLIAAWYFRNRLKSWFGGLYK